MLNKKDAVPWKIDLSRLQQTLKLGSSLSKACSEEKNNDMVGQPFASPLGGSKGDSVQPYRGFFEEMWHTTF